MHDTLEGWLCVLGGWPSYRVFISLKKKWPSYICLFTPRPIENEHELPWSSNTWNCDVLGNQNIFLMKLFSFFHLKFNLVQYLKFLVNDEQH